MLDRRSLIKYGLGILFGATVLPPFLRQMLWSGNPDIFIRQLGTDYVNPYLGKLLIKSQYRNATKDSIYKRVLLHIRQLDWIQNYGSVKQSVSSVIDRDFFWGNTIILDGWILSKTVADICVLSSFVKSDAY